MLASLLCTSTTIAQESAYNSDYNVFLVTYDAMALDLGLIPDNISVFKVNVHPEFSTHEQAVAYFLKLASVLIQMMSSDLIHLGSLKNKPIQVQLGYFNEILYTCCKFLNTANESQNE
ncbi:hypothetical protein DSO57_1000616 [Entomophthora muscae]|uniref:Uncharacterized protein n=1 Tax=Entomophthora muscae TaxID=34485 RepID=A0ACC2S085_9FUNG|nr:hypothetical protein DSO57_1000616 [Entomophthora muscae]